jgi:hypothetical protein
MQTQKTGHAANIVLLLTACLAGAQLLLAAQGAGAPPQPAQPPVRISVQTTVVKPEMVLTWQDLIRHEAIPAYKNAGVPWRWVFTSAGPIGPGFTFVTVSPVTNFAQLDQGNPLRKALGDEGIASYNAKLRATLVSTNNVIETLVQNASLVSFSSTPPNLVIVQTVVLQQGKGPDWAAITASDFLPVLKKGGVTDYWVYATTFGAPGNVRTIVQPIANYAALDAGPSLNQAIGADAAAKLNQKRNALVTSAENTVMRYVPDLSFGVPQRPKS